jgi:succinate dehydrogenase/fumarate reductase-like Fe-S protein
VCHVLREHEEMEQFGGPRFFVRVAALEMHPLDSKSRTRMLKVQHYEVLHGSVSRGDSHHGQRDHPVEGARG